MTTAVVMVENDTSMNELRKYLESRGIQPSFHRLKILEYLITHRTHPTVENIHKALSREIPTLSKTTIYNTLKLFLSKGLVWGLTIDENKLRYDFNTEPHAHFKCIKCGRVLDVSLELPPLGSIEGHKVMETHLYLKGICKDCLKG